MDSNRQNGLAITSMVLGILSFVLCLGPLLGVPAIICGHVAHSRAKKRPENFSGGGMAIAGFVMGYVGLLLFPALAAVLLPALAKTQITAQSIQCENNLHVLSDAALFYASDHDETLPESVEELVSSLEAHELSALICPATRTKTIATSPQTVTAENISYQFPNLGKHLSETDGGRIVFVRCPIHGHEGLLDGTVIQGTTSPSNGP